MLLNSVKIPSKLYTQWFHALCFLRRKAGGLSNSLAEENKIQNDNVYEGNNTENNTIEKGQSCKTWKKKRRKKQRNNNVDTGQLKAAPPTCQQLEDEWIDSSGMPSRRIKAPKGAVVAGIDIRRRLKLMPERSTTALPNLGKRSATPTTLMETVEPTGQGLAGRRHSLATSPRNYITTPLPAVSFDRHWTQAFA